jgi:hypothetical protein
MRRSFQLLAVPLLLWPGCGPPATSPSPPSSHPRVGGDFPLDAARLTNVWLIDDPVEWVFTDSEFYVQSSRELLPVDLSEALFLKGTSGTRVEGKWTLDVAQSQLVLSELRSGDGPTLESAMLPISPAGAVRVNLGVRQYNLLPLSKRTE